MAIPQWAIGRHVSVITLTPQNIGTGGVLTDTTPVRNFVGHVRDIKFSVTATVENISSIHDPQEHNIPYETGYILEMTELGKLSGVNLAAAAAFSVNSIVRYTITRGAQTFTGFGVIQQYDLNVEKPRVDESLKIVGVFVSGFPTYS